MGIFRSFSEIVNSMIERLRLTQPDLDTKEGTVARDLFIDIQADQLQQLHSAIVAVSEKQSPELAVGKDLDRWASNFGITRNTGTSANGIVVFTTNSINVDLPIPNGTLVFARNGLRFKTIGNYIMSSAEKNRFASNATRLRNSLNLAGISDSFAIEIPVQAVATGTNGNISSFQVIEHNLLDGLNVTNITSFNGGANVESDASFRARVFSVFSGSNTGTAFGYRNAAISIDGVNDALVIEPGDSLMQRDGTEVIKVNDGSYRILNSGTGGKVDLYILGKKLEEISESYLYVDRSGIGDATDERNHFILGQGNLDKTLTTEERRVQAFKNNILPLQPVNAIVSVSGSISGIFQEKFTDANGNVLGNFELVKDTNVDTGGSPFGFDKLIFISNKKDVSSENIVKKLYNGVDALTFSNVESLTSVYQDIAIVGENSNVSTSNRSIIKLKHYPVVNVTRVSNKTTGEIYTVESQNKNSDGVNTSGEIIISGKSLPTSSDVLSTDYTWRVTYDPYTDYNGYKAVDPTVASSIDWGTSNFINQEEALISKSSDDLEYLIETNYEISRVISAYLMSQEDSSIVTVDNNGTNATGIILSEDIEQITNIISVTNSSGVEIYNTDKSDGSFSGRTIILPSDAVTTDTDVTVKFNKVELYKVDNTDAAFSGNIITLPSSDILTGNSLDVLVNEAYLASTSVYVDYISSVKQITPIISLSSLPLTGVSTTNNLFNNSLSVISNSNQPIFYSYNGNNISGLLKYSPARLSCSTSGTNNSGKLKITGQTLTRYTVQVEAGLVMSGLKLSLLGIFKDLLNTTNLTSNYGIAKVNSISSEDNDDIDLIGYKLNTNVYDFGKAQINSSLKNYEFELNQTTSNNALSFSSGSILTIDFVMYNSTDSEELYFSGNNKVITEKVFGRIERVSVTSGFRITSGNITGSIQIVPFNQPEVGTTYLTDYSFTAPIEGERITIKYSLNRLVSDVTANLEKVRSITADVLVKEAVELAVDVSGEIIINSSSATEKDSIIDNAKNAVVNLLNTGELGRTIDYSDIINAVTSVTGVDSCNISLFNESGKTGRRTYISALNNQSIIAGEVDITAISRKNFKIT